MFAKKAVGLLIAIREDKSKGTPTRDMQGWVDINKIRAVLMDIPAWVCYLVAVSSVL